jgi:hypothetical protein
MIYIYIIANIIHLDIEKQNKERNSCNARQSLGSTAAFVSRIALPLKAYMIARLLGRKDWWFALGPVGLFDMEDRFSLFL